MDDASEPEKEKTKPKIVSNIILPRSPFISAGPSQTQKHEDGYERLQESTRRTFSKEEFEIIPDMTPEKPEEKAGMGNPDPRWAPIQVASSPNTHGSTLEEGELVETEEDWDAPDGKRRIRVRHTDEVSSFALKNNFISKLRETELEKYIDEKVYEKVDSFLKEKNRLNKSAHSLINLTDKIQVQVSEEMSGTNRVYKLTANLTFEMFEDYLRSELKTKRLEYILDKEKCTNVPESKLTDDIDRVRDIIINHIDIYYYTKIVDLREPSEIIIKLKEYKRLETRVTSVSARKDLYDLKI